MEEGNRAPSLRTTGPVHVTALNGVLTPQVGGACLRMSKPRPFVLTGVDNLFWGWLSTVHTQQIRGDRGPRTPCVSIFVVFCRGLSAGYSRCARLHWSQLGSSEFVLIVLNFCIFCSLLCLRPFLSPLFLRRGRFRQTSTGSVANNGPSEHGLNFHHTTTVHFCHQTDFSKSVASSGCWVFIFVVIRSSQCQYFTECYEIRLYAPSIILYPFFLDDVGKTRLVTLFCGRLELHHKQGKHWIKVLWKNEFFWSLSEWFDLSLLHYSLFDCLCDRWARVCPEMK